VNRRTALAVAALPLVVATVAGCGSTSSSKPGDTHVMSDGQTMSGSSMAGMQGRHGTTASGAGAAGPSEGAAMVCGEEIRSAVGHTLQLASVPRGLHAWSHHMFRCSYLVGAGELRLSVKDLDAGGPGRAYFDALHGRLPHASYLHGVEALGFPSFETREGDVVFLKDHKTLWVDASRLSQSGLPRGMSRTEVAYGVASAVIACWSE
jgi:hypothetical protein